MMLHAKIDELADGQTLLLLASDPATKRDVPKFCQFLGHELVSTAEDNMVFSYLIKKSKAE